MIYLTPFKTHCRPACLSRSANFPPSRRRSLSPVTGAARAGYGFHRLPELTYRKTPVPLQKVIEKKTTRQIVQNTAVHLHQSIVHRHIHRQYTVVHALRQDAFLIVMPKEKAVRSEQDDPSRPARTAQRLLRLFSRESVRRELQPFYSGVVRNVLREEQDRFRGRPAQAISLIWNLFGRRQAFRTLTRFYMNAVSRLGSSYYPALNSPNALFLAANILFHSRIYRREIRQLWRHELLTARRPPREQTALEAELYVMRRAAPPRELVERAAEEPAPAARSPGEAQRPVQLSEADFRALVRGVARSLGRETRLEALRRGRY